MAAKKVYLMAVHTHLVFDTSDYYMVTEKKDVPLSHRIPITEMQFEQMKAKFNYSMVKRITNKTDTVTMWFS